MKELIISIDEYENRAAVIEDGELVEIYIERTGHRSMVGNVYMGSVKDILPGMDAAFVDVGLEKNAFLCADEIVFFDEAIDSPRRKIEQMIKPGQRVLIQVVKEPMGLKGAKVTTEITLPGRFLVLMPFSNTLGLSRRLGEEEKEDLKRIAERIKPEGMGMIVRTASSEANPGDFQRDLDYLVRTWNAISSRAKKIKPPALVYLEPNLFLRIVRDLFSTDFKRLLIDSLDGYKQIQSYLSKVAPNLKKRVSFYQEKVPLFEKFGIDEQIEAALKPKVWLRSGGYLVIDQTEALTTIDVNTGKYTGGKRLEETILKTNLEATHEVVRQLRLRDIGGMIVIDFIDMDRQDYRNKVFSALNDALAEDRTKTKVIEISQLGLVEMTRKNVSGSLAETLCESCPRCRGTGLVLSEETAGIIVERKIRKILYHQTEKAFLVRANPNIVSFLVGKRRAHLNRIEKETGKNLLLFGDENFPPEYFKLVKAGSLKDVQEALAQLR